MKKNYSTIVAVVSCILAVVCLFQNYQLKQDIAYLKTQQSSIRSSVQTDISNIYSQVKSMLEQEASLLSHSDWEYGTAYVEDGKVEVICSVTPKEYSAEQTVATLYCSGNAYPMELKNGQYISKLELSVFENCTVERVVFTEGDATRTEELGWGISPRYDYLTRVYGILEYSVRNGKEADGKYIWDMDAVIHISAERKGNHVEVQSMALVAELDGKEVDRMDIPLSSAINAEPGSNVHQYEYEFKKQYEMPLGSEFFLYLETVDGDNLYHRNVLELFEAKEQEGLDTATPVQSWNGAESNIYDAEGNPLFEFDWSRYK